MEFICLLMEIITIWLYFITYGILKELRHISHLLYIILGLLSIQNILQFIFCYDYWKAMPTMLTVVTQEYSMSVPVGIPHTDIAFQTARIYIWVCMILLQKMFKSLQPSHSFGYSSEDLWIICFYSRAGTIYLLKNIRK